MGKVAVIGKQEKTRQKPVERRAQGSKGKQQKRRQKLQKPVEQYSGQDN